MIPDPKANTLAPLPSVKELHVFSPLCVRWLKAFGTYDDSRLGCR